METLHPHLNEIWTTTPRVIPRRTFALLVSEYPWMNALGVFTSSLPPPQGLELIMLAWCRIYIAVALLNV